MRRFIPQGQFQRCVCEQNDADDLAAHTVAHDEDPIHESQFVPPPIVHRCELSIVGAAARLDVHPPTQAHGPNLRLSFFDGMTAGRHHSHDLVRLKIGLEIVVCGCNNRAESKPTYLPTKIERDRFSLKQEKGRE